MARQAEKLTALAMGWLLSLALFPSHAHAEAFGVAIKPRGWGFSATTVINGKLEMELVIDSGSSFTIISHQAARQLGIFKQLGQAPRYPLSAGGGIVWVRLVVLESVRVGGAVAHGVEGAVADLPSFKGAHGLLGKSYLDRYSFRINSPAKTMELAPHNNEPLYGGRSEGWWRNEAKRLRGQATLFQDMEQGVENSIHTGYTPERLLKQKLSKSDVGRLASYFKMLLARLEKEASSLGAPEEWMR
ncbi:MAG: retroviral-like aspartic protease family protein [Nitrospinota bacterium]|nr:retroviral-like aspartic protease family protein [Nitrospinota bacterium]MDH5678341.1 retroviral-like aspartic protease family protein [Nitrospinota bacterium]MDH5755369.1 retroviral-like aspartic protease family protein [Nitrospinota bacterium]